MFPCSDPLQAGNAGNIPAGIVSSFSVTGFERSIIPRDLTAWERKTTGKQTFPREGENGELYFLRKTFGTGMGASSIGLVGPRERYLNGNVNESQFP